MPPEISVVIVTWNGRHYLEGCLEAVATQTDVEPEIVLVDNGSSDGTVDFVRSRFPGVRIVALGENRGFAGGNNAGARAARGEFLAFLNNDTIPESTWLRALRDGIDAPSRFLLTTSRIVYMHDSSVIDSAGDGVFRAGGAFKRHHGARADAASASGEVFGVCGAACLVSEGTSSRNSADSTKTFSRRTKTSICRTGLVCAAIGADTSRTQSSGITEARHSVRGSVSAVFHGQRNLEWMYLKNTPASLLVRTLPGHLVYNAASAAYFARMGLPRCVSESEACGGSWSARDRAQTIGHSANSDGRRARDRGAPRKTLAVCEGAREAFRRSTRGAMTTPRVSAILVNYNAGLELRRALQSIADELAGNAWEAVVVDNGSSDGSTAIVEELAPQVRLLRNGENVGFARGMNQGLAATTAPRVLIMNPDCRLMPARSRR